MNDNSRMAWRKLETQYDLRRDNDNSEPIQIAEGNSHEFGMCFR